MPRLQRRANRRVRQANTPAQGEAHTEADAPAEPEVSSEAVAEDIADGQNNEAGDPTNVIETNVIETAESERAEEAAVTETRNRRRKRKSRPNGGTPSTMAGMIFMCSTATKKDCFKYGVFGFPEQKKDSVAQVKKGMKLFLYDVDKKHLHGVYQAISRGGMNLVPEAFQGSDRKFPAQVKFRIHKDCIPLSGPAFKEAIKDSTNHGGRFNAELTVEQVRKLMQLFRPLDSEGMQPPAQLRHVQDAQRESALQDAHRSLQERHAYRVPPQGQHVARPLPPTVSAREPARWYGNEHLPVGLDYYHAQPSYLPPSQIGSYLPPRIATTEVDAAGRRYLDTLYLQGQSMVAQRPFAYDPLYRGAEYQREVPYYSSYGVSRSLGFPP